MRWLRLAALVFLFVAASESRVGADERAPALVAGSASQATAPAPEESHARRASAIALARVRPAPPIQPPTLPETAITRPPRVPLYVGPGLTFAVRTFLPPNARLPIRAVLADESWFKVEWRGQTGWVRTEALRLPSP